MLKHDFSGVFFLLELPIGVALNIENNNFCHFSRAHWYTEILKALKESQIFCWLKTLRRHKSIKIYIELISKRVFSAVC